MDTLDEVRAGLPEGGMIDLVEVPGGVRVRAAFTFRHRLDGSAQRQTVGSDPYRVFAPSEAGELASALRDARKRIDAKARLHGLG